MTLAESFKVYLVGGAVRDSLLGLPVKDRDWVVVGATPEAMLAAGFLPVGKDFPVFLHPDTHEEFALARTERKTAAGYHGFAFHTDPSVTLEEDLLRRDLTINAMAQTPAGVVIDPYGGQQDLQSRVLRHVSSAFAEDPVRILRLARFAARYADFTVAPETSALMQQMVQAGEVDALVAERVWQEWAKGLMERTPSRMVAVLKACGALARLFSALDALLDQPHQVLDLIDRAASHGLGLPGRYAYLAWSLASTTLARQMSDQWRVPHDCRDMAELLLREHAALIHTAQHGSATEHVALLMRCDAFRKPERFIDALAASDVIAESDGIAVSAHWRECLRVCQNVSTREVSSRAMAQGLRGEAIAQAIAEARAEALQAQGLAND